MTYLVAIIVGTFVGVAALVFLIFRDVKAIKAGNTKSKEYLRVAMETCAKPTIEQPEEAKRQLTELRLKLATVQAAEGKTDDLR